MINSKYFGIFFILASVRIEAIQEFYPPILNYNKEFIDLPAKSIFTIKCEGKYPVQWKLPEMWESSIKERSLITKEYNSGFEYPYKSKLVLNSTKSTDTGRYYCYYDNATNLVDKAKFTSIYLYANDPFYLFVENKQSAFTLFPSIIYGSESVIPCLPTHSTTNVTFLKSTDYGLENIEFGEEVAFDPMRGVIIRYPSQDYSGIFICRAEHNEFVTEISLFAIYYGETSGTPEPNLDKFDEPHAVLNSSYRLRCVTRTSAQTRIDMQFDYPARDKPGAVDRINVSDIQIKADIFTPGYIILHRDLYINPVTYEDKGFYKCIASDHMKKKGETETFVDVLVIDPPAYVNLTTDVLESNEMDINSNFIFAVKYFIFPAKSEVEFVWRKDNQFLDETRQKPVRLKNSSQVILTINTLKREDAGTYVLSAITKDMTTNLSMKLTVNEKPRVTVFKNFHYLKKGQVYKLFCGAIGYPTPRIFWTWKPCIYKNKCNAYYEHVKKENYGYINDSSFYNNVPKDIEFKMDSASVLNVNASKSGYYQCNANNHLKTSSSDPQELIVSETGVGLDLTMSKINPIVLDNVTLTCRANYFEYREVRWYWYEENAEKKVELDGKNLKNDDLTVESQLNFRPINLNNAGTYICSAIYRLNSTQKSISVKVNIRDMVQPEMNATNLLGKKVTIEKTKRFEFFCYVHGVPRPNIVWFKNQSPLNITSLHGVDIIDSNQKIIINRLVESDSGEYMCIAENRAGVISSSMTLSVEADVITDPEDNNTVLIAIICVTILVVIVLIGFLAKRIRKDKKLKLDLELEGFKNFDQGRLDMYNPDLPLDDQAELLPYDKRWEFPKDRLILGKTLGQGAFGRVVRAEAIGISDYENSTTVAVKMLKEKLDKTQLKALIAELKIMIHLGKHLNVVNMLGAVTKNIARGELMVIVEFCKYGNLRHYLLHQRRNFIDQVSPDSGEIDINIQTQSSFIGKNRKLSVRATENDQAEKQLHYADIVHAYKRGISREDSKTDSVTGTTAELSRSYSNCAKDRINRSTSSSSNNSFKRNNSIHRAVLTRTVSSSADATTMTRLSNVDSCGSSIPGDVFSDNSESGEVFTSSGMNFKYKGDLKDTPLTTCDLLCFSFQIARGMEYLSSKKLIHRDLAARNILLAEDNVVKICDFGLAKDCYKYSNYVKKGDGPLPIKWMAVESIRDKVFTTQTDVWSYGILLWEIFTLGGNPYPGIEVDENFFKKLKNGYRMEKPEYCPDSVFKLIEESWEAEPIDRPNFPELAEKMGDLLEGSMKQYYIDLNNPFELLNEELQNNNDYLTMEGKNRDSNYLNMVGSNGSENEPFSEDQSAHYDNIKLVRPVNSVEGEEIILKPPMEVVPMIRFSNEGNELQDLKLPPDSTHKDSPSTKKNQSCDETHPLTDYIYMGSPKKKEFTNHPFAITSKNDGNDSSKSADKNVDPPPSYSSVFENSNDKFEVLVAKV